MVFLASARWSPQIVKGSKPPHLTHIPNQFCSSILTVQLLQFFIYVSHSYYHIKLHRLNLLQARILTSIFHEGLIYTSILLVIGHTYNLNQKTLRLVTLINQAHVDLDKSTKTKKTQNNLRIGSKT